MNPLIQLTNAANAIGYDFRNVELLWEALQAAGSPVSHIGERRLLEGNKPLGGVGDATFSLVLKRQSRVLGLPIGESTQQISDLVKNRNLAAICDRIGLTNCINLNPAAQGQVHMNLKATTLEAVIGAVLEDSDLDTVESIMDNLGLTLTHNDTVMFKTTSPPPPHTRKTYQTQLSVSINLDYCSSPFCDSAKHPRFPSRYGPLAAPRKGLIAKQLLKTQLALISRNQLTSCP